MKCLVEKDSETWKVMMILTKEKDFFMWSKILKSLDKYMGLISLDKWVGRNGTDMLISSCGRQSS